MDTQIAIITQTLTEEVMQEMRSAKAVAYDAQEAVQRATGATLALQELLRRLETAEKQDAVMRADRQPDPEGL